MHLLDVRHKIEFTIGRQAAMGTLEGFQFFVHGSYVGPLVPSLSKRFVTKVAFELFHVVLRRSLVVGGWRRGVIGGHSTKKTFHFEI